MALHQKKGAVTSAPGHYRPFRPTRCPVDTSNGAVNATTIGEDGAQNYKPAFCKDQYALQGLQLRVLLAPFSNAAHPKIARVFDQRAQRSIYRDVKRRGTKICT